MQMNRPTTRLGACAFAVAFTISSVSNAEVIFEDPVTHFQIALDSHGAQMCILKPSKFRSSSNCDGLDIAAAEQTIELSTSLLMMFRFGESWNALNVSVQPKSHPGPMTRVQAKEFVKGATEQGLRNARGRADGTAFDLLIVNDLQVLRFLSELDAAGTAVTVINHLVVGREELVTLTFLAHEVDLPQVHAVADGTLATMAWTPAETPASWPPGAPPARKLGRAIGKFLVSVVKLMALCFGGVLLYRVVRRR